MFKSFALPGSFDALAPEFKAMFVDNARVLTLNESKPAPRHLRTAWAAQGSGDNIER